MNIVTSSCCFSVFLSCLSGSTYPTGGANSTYRLQKIGNQSILPFKYEFAAVVKKGQVTFPSLDNCQIGLFY